MIKIESSSKEWIEAVSSQRRRSKILVEKVCQGANAVGGISNLTD
jgi:hypothetical protein